MKRLEALREKLADNELDAIFLQQRENLLYMTGFTGTAGGLVVTADKAVVLVDSRYLEQAQSQCEGYEVIISDRPYEIGKVLKGEKRIGFEENVITFEVYQLLMAEVTMERTLVPAAEVLRELRTFKDEEELEKLKTAVKIADNAFHHILPFLREGVAEIDIATEMDFFMRKEGATGPSFDFIIAGGARSALPHGVASRHKLEANAPVLMDYGCIYQNYCSDITRTVFLGDPGEEAKALYQIVKEGQKRGYANSLVGKPIAFAEEAVRSYFASLELDDYFGHSLGHGVGLEIHEAPTVNRKNQQKFKNGMVYTIEPGIYLPGQGGVRIEDMVLMTYQGPVQLTEAPKELIIL